MKGGGQTFEQARRNAALETELGRLAELSRSELVAHWRRHYRGDPPKGISRSLLLGAIAYKLQAKRSGGLGLAVRRRLKRMAGVSEGAVPAEVRSRRRLATGTRFVREWNGTTHVVEADDNGVIWNGQHYRSLSAVALAITGARWSGPRFFGLTS